MKLNEMKRTIFNNSAGRPKLLQNSEIPLHATKGELVDAYGIDFTFDFAIPNDWACVAQDVSRSDGGWWHVIWAYDEKSGGWGRPFPLTLEAFHVIQETNERLGWLVPQESDFDFFFIPPQK